MKIDEQDADHGEERGLDVLHVDAYPTDQRLKYQQTFKEDKLAGKAPKRKPQVVEQHFDDCVQTLVQSLLLMPDLWRSSRFWSA